MEAPFHNDSRGPGHVKKAYGNIQSPTNGATVEDLESHRIRRLTLAGIRYNRARQLVRSSKGTTERREGAVVGRCHARKVQGSPQRPRSDEGRVRIRSLFSPIQYVSFRKHKYTDEPMPLIPDPWTKLNPPRALHQPKEMIHMDLEDGEVFEVHSLSPSPILPMLNAMIPPQLASSQLLQNFIQGVKTEYLVAKGARMEWERLRDRFKSPNFQALVNDYLADCQMRRDRGEITDEECNVCSSSIVNLLFAEQIVVEDNYKTAEMKLQALFHNLSSLKEVSVIAGLSGAMEREGLINDLISASKADRSDIFQRSVARTSSPEPVQNCWSDTTLESSSEEHEGLSLLNGYQDRLRISRALDQRVPFTRRHFNGKLTTFNEVRFTDRRRDAALDKILLKTGNPILHHGRIEGERPQLLIGDRPLLTTTAVDLTTDKPVNEDLEPLGSRRNIESEHKLSPSWRSFHDKCIVDDKVYCDEVRRISRIAEASAIRSGGGNRCVNSKFTQARHVLFGNYPSAGRKKFADEESMGDDDDDDFSPSSLMRYRRKLNKQIPTSTSVGMGRGGIKMKSKVPPFSPTFVRRQHL
eukprot:GHVH01004827.1.p1 GENE.GHVH01004827.1~~GHVH01004827.1.p1  ORF type:complete len:582 (+),score=71.41 GHVH01004827.1:437-2182(+)